MPNVAWHVGVMHLMLLTPWASALAASPSVGNMLPRGLQVGATTMLTFEGAGLNGQSKIISTLPILRQELQQGVTDRRVQIAVTLDSATPPGFYQLYLATAGGISPPLGIAVDNLPQVPASDEAPLLPVALHGSLTGSGLLRTKIAAKAGQRLALEVEARRLGSALNPVLRLYDARHVQLAWSQGLAALSGDARIDLRLPADGTYTVELHDALFRGANPGFYRLKLGDFHYADLVYPVGIQRGTQANLEFPGASFPAGVSVALDAVTADPVIPAAWPAGLHVTGGHPRVYISDLPELTETAVTGKDLQQAPVPVAISGRLLAAGEEDRYRLEVAPGMKLRVDVLAGRLGSPLDGVLTVYNVQGRQLATNDDRPETTDPGLDFTVPPQAKAVVLALKDLHGRGGPDAVYRVVVQAADQPDFKLSLAEDRIEVPQNGPALLHVKAQRSNYNGPIKLSLADVSSELQLSSAEIPAGISNVLVTLSGNAAPTHQVTHLLGEAVEPLVGVRAALLPENGLTRHQPWLRKELGLAVTAPVGIELAWEEISAEQSLPLGGDLPARLSARRAEGVKGPIRISLLTNQVVPQKKENNKDVDDVAKALRLEGSPLIPIEQTEVSTNLLIPADLPLLPYDLVFKGELLSLDGKRVLSTVYTPARRLSPAK